MVKVKRLPDPFHPPYYDLDDIYLRQDGGTVTGDVEIDGLLTLTDGQIKFPATQNPSADANTLDDYEENTWTPTLTFVVPGDLSVTYSTRIGTYMKIGRQVTAYWTVTTSAFTHSTASQSLAITALPFAAEATASQEFYGSLSWQGITKAGYTTIVPRLLASSTTVSFVGSGSGAARSLVVPADMPSGGNVVLIGSLTYRAAS